MNNKDDFELIDAFIEKVLTHDEEIRFQDKLKNDPEFAKQFYFYKYFNMHVQKAVEYKKVRSNIAEVLEQKPIIALNTKIFFAIAASIVIFLGIYIVNKTGNPEENTLATLKKSDSIAYAKTDNFSVGFNFDPGQIIEITQTESINKMILSDELIEKNILAKGESVNSLIIYRNRDIVDTMYYFGKRPLSSDSYIYISDTLINNKDYFKILSLFQDGQYELISKDSIAR